MKRLVIILSMMSLFSEVHAEPFQDGFRYGTYGVVAGALAGGASIALSDDPGSNLSPVARGASLGLYAGLLVAVVQNFGGWNEPTLNVQPVSWQVGKEQGLGIAFSRRF